MSDLDDFLAGYATAMLWANAVDATGTPADVSHLYMGPGRWWEDSPVDLLDAACFYAEESDWLVATGQDDFSQHGHDFALTRNHHGAGFWDRGYSRDVGDHLTAASDAYGEATVELDYATTEGVLTVVGERSGLDLTADDLTHDGDDILIDGMPWDQWLDAMTME